MQCFDTKADKIGVERSSSWDCYGFILY